MNWTKKRNDWRKARDDNGIKKGAVAGVSIGDAIGKMAKAEEKGYPTLLAAANSLKGNLVKYQSGLKKVKGSKDFSGWIAKNFMKDVDGLIADISADLKSVKGLHNTARNSVDLRALIPELSMVQEANNLMKSKPNLSWFDAIKKLNQYSIVANAAKEFSITAKAYRNVKFKYPLKTDYQKFFVDFGKQLQSDIAFSVKWVTSKSQDDFINSHKSAKAREWAHNKNGDLAKAFQFLMK